MKIKSIEYQNFRNFKEKGKIKFDTDGKATIIYGINGAGKTTFHQLIQWVLYGSVNFNKTTSNTTLYNLSLADNQKVNKPFSVVGIIEFEHLKTDYRVRREAIFVKSVYDGVVKKEEKFIITKKTHKNDWISVEDPVDLIEELLPSGLKNYFFFDGENMIADLKLKGADAAKNLKKALFRMLDLWVYDESIKVIGEKEHSTTVIGSIYLSTDDTQYNQKLETQKLLFLDIQEKINEYEEKLKKFDEEIIEKENRIKEISEQIGAAKSQKDYEIERNKIKEKIIQLKEELADLYRDFGDEMISTFPKLFLSAIILKAEKKLKKKMESSNLIPGINKEFLDSLLKQNTCICGNVLSENEREKIESIYKLLPPHSYDTLYFNFNELGKRWGKEYDPEKIKKYLTRTTKKIKEINEQEAALVNINNLMKDDKIYEELVNERIILENSKEKLKIERDKCAKTYNLLITKRGQTQKELDKISRDLKIRKQIDDKIEIMARVKEYFEELLTQKSKSYSEKLEKIIQDIIDKILYAGRKVRINDEFLLKVTDEYGDESKSEGQFATVSFAYICGIFKLLKEEEIIRNKEYPLILDAPFSKLGKEPRDKVIEMLPSYASQIIILSKDNLNDVFDKEKIGKIYNISCNKEQNIANIEEVEEWK